MWNSELQETVANLLHRIDRLEELINARTKIETNRRTLKTDSAIGLYQCEFHTTDDFSLCEAVKMILDHLGIDLVKEPEKKVVKKLKK